MGRKKVFSCMQLPVKTGLWGWGASRRTVSRSNGGCAREPTFIPRSVCRDRSESEFSETDPDGEFGWGGTSVKR